VLQKNVSYKRLFSLWRDKNSKTQQGRLSSKELKAGLKKLRAGLTMDEIDKLISNIPFEGKDNSIAASLFESIVVQGAKKLEDEKQYEKLLLQSWISEFNTALFKDAIPLERVF
jgi:Ca2+-binding EF-hand superfamily protein